MNIQFDFRRNLPIAGIAAFSLCSVWSLYQLLTKSAAHPTYLFVIPAVLVEIVTAWIIYQVVEQARRVTRSNISKQDKRFYSLILGAFVLVAIPTLTASIWANTLEFGNLLLGLLFPGASIGCAISVALPDTIARYEHRKEMERQRLAMERKARQREKEMERKQAEMRRQEAESKRQFLGHLGAAGQTLALYESHPDATQAEIADAVGVSERTIRNHLVLLERMGLVRRNDGNVEIVGPA